LSPVGAALSSGKKQILAPKVPLLIGAHFTFIVNTQGSVRAFGTLATLGYEEYRA